MERMKLDVDFTGLNLAAAKMRGLDEYLTALRTAQKTYSDGLDLAETYVLDNGGSVEKGKEEGVTVLSLLGIRAYCFQLYPDIDLFYFET